MLSQNISNRFSNLRLLLIYSMAVPTLGDLKNIQANTTNEKT